MCDIFVTIERIYTKVYDKLSKRDRFYTKEYIDMGVGPLVLYAGDSRGVRIHLHIRKQKFSCGRHTYPKTRS